MRREVLSQWVCSKGVFLRLCGLLCMHMDDVGWDISTKMKCLLPVHSVRGHALLLRPDLNDGPSSDGFDFSASSSVSDTQTQPFVSRLPLLGTLS